MVRNVRSISAPVHPIRAAGVRGFRSIQYQHFFGPIHCVSGCMHGCTNRNLETVPIQQDTGSVMGGICSTSLTRREMLLSRRSSLDRRKGQAEKSAERAIVYVPPEIETKQGTIPDRVEVVATQAYRSPTNFMSEELYDSVFRTRSVKQQGIDVRLR